MRLIRYSLCLALAGCTQFPELADSEGPEVAAAGFPRLLTSAELAALPESTTSDAVQTSLLARLAALEARAARLRARPVIDRTTRARMARGIR